MKLLSIIIPIYNSEKYLRDCIESVYQQELPLDDFELILINDGSTDDSFSICKEFQHLYGNIVIYSKNNEGQAVARNLGVKHARGKYIMFLDSDDRLISNTIPKLLHIAEENRTEITLSNMRVFQNDGKSKIVSDYPNYGKVVTGEYSILHGLNFGSVCARLFLREYIARYNFRFESEIKHEDVLFSIMVFSFSHRVISTDLCTYVYNWNIGSTDRSFDAINKKKSVLSDLRIVEEEKLISENDKISCQLRHYLIKHSNSIVVSNCLEVITYFFKDRDFKEHFYRVVKEKQFLPIKGKTLNWKTTLLSIFLNLCYKIGVF